MILIPVRCWVLLSWSHVTQIYLIPCSCFAEFARLRHPTDKGKSLYLAGAKVSRDPFRYGRAEQRVPICRRESGGQFFGRHPRVCELCDEGHWPTTYISSCLR